MTPRPDNREPAVIWYWFEKEWEKGLDYPSVSWAVGSDWGVGFAAMTPEQYKEAAYSRMRAIYGEQP